MLLQVFIDQYQRNPRLLNECKAAIAEDKNFEYDILSLDLIHLGDELSNRHENLEKLTGHVFIELREKYNVGNSADYNI